MDGREKCSFGKIGRSFQFLQHLTHPNLAIGEQVATWQHSVHPRKNQFSGVGATDFPYQKDSWWNVVPSQHGNHHPMEL
jgi:hypothetical protein